MATQIKIGIDNETVILEGADAENLLNFQKELQRDQKASEQIAADRVSSLKVSYKKFLALGFTVAEVKVIFSSLGLTETDLELAGA